MAIIKTTGGRRIDIDAADPVMLDLLEAIRETLKARGSDYDTEDAVNEIRHLVNQMSREETQAFLREFMHFGWLRYEEDQIARDYEQKIGKLKSDA
jgi:hypothetical protein